MDETKPDTMHFNGHPIFWLVWSPTRGTPTVRHNRYEHATMEARRLAEKHPNDKFYVLVTAAVAYAAPNPVIVAEY